MEGSECEILAVGPSADSLKRHLPKHRYRRVTAVPDYVTAFETAEKKKFALVVLDLGSVRENGRLLSAICRNTDNEEIRAILVASADEIERFVATGSAPDIATSIGAQDYIERPFQIKAMVAAIAEQLPIPTTTMPQGKLARSAA